MAFIREDCSEVALSMRLCHSCEARRYSYRSCHKRLAKVRYHHIQMEGYCHTLKLTTPSLGEGYLQNFLLGIGFELVLDHNLVCSIASCLRHVGESLDGGVIRDCRPEHVEHSGANQAGTASSLISGFRISLDNSASFTEVHDAVGTATQTPLTGTNSSFQFHDKLNISIKLTCARRRSRS